MYKLGFALVTASLLAVGCAGAPKSTTKTYAADAPRRISGDTNIELDARYRAQVTTVAGGELDGALKLCVAPDGSVEDVRVIRSTGIGDYDRKAMKQVAGWRYEPYAAPSSDTRVCQNVSLVYKQL